MRFFGLELKGEFWIQRLPDITGIPWTTADEGRLVYNEADDVLYYGNDREWVRSTQANYTFNVNQQIIFGLDILGGTALPDDWNIPDDIDDRVPIITNLYSSCGQRGGNWTMDNIIVAAGSHNHFTPEGMGIASRAGKRGNSEIYATAAIDTHKHTISYDGVHTHAFDGSWRFPHALWTIGEYQP